MNLEKIWAEYRASLKAFLHSKVSNAADVDDLLQDILLKTYQNLSKVRENESIKSWLFQIANHSIIDFYRRNKTFSELNQEEAVSETVWLKAQERNIKQELSACIEPFIHALDESDAELLITIDINGESQRQYAENLGISYSTLKSRVQKARAQLRSLFDNCCKMELDTQGNLMEYQPQKRFADSNSTKNSNNSPCNKC
ncbi:MAG: RNA polymerase sigma factor SigZ [Oleispira sp.]|nr:RNA polymerase sigma factor SigZ [Oleispira sp.]MBL4881800.1 RNA polymerase sigma factor SigZ [Oleispira sp.]